MLMLVSSLKFNFTAEAAEKAFGIMKLTKLRVVGVVITWYGLAVYLAQAAYGQGNIAQQQVYLNIPAYTLSLYTQYPDNHWERLMIPVGIGQVAPAKYQTPIGRGELYAKATGVTFQYGEQNPGLAGKIIEYSHTFDKATLKPVTIKMPHDMKSVFMRLNSDFDGQFYDQFVIHETTDWYTIGTPASKGCVRVDRDDMQRLYNAIEPSSGEGTFFSPIPIVTYYDVCEYYPEQQMVVVHANIYNRQVDYAREVLADLREAGIDTSLMNMVALTDIVQQAEAQFAQVIHTIQQKLKKAPFGRLISEQEKQLLHFRFYLHFQY
jgi:hypothetical protein